MWKSLTPTVNLRWSMQNGTDKKKKKKRGGGGVKIHIWLPCETCMRYEKRLCCFIVKVRNCRTDFPNFWWTVCSRWRRSAHGQCRTVFSVNAPPPPPPPSICILYYITTTKKDPKCTGSHLSVFQCEHCVTKRRSARWVKLNGAVSRSHTFTARANCEPTEFTESLHSSLTQNCRLNGRDRQG